MATSCETEPIVEDRAQIDDVSIGYQRYGQGPEKFIFICGGVGSYKKDFPEQVLRAFDPNLFTIVCLDPPGYGTSQPPVRKQERNRCKMDAKYCIGLMKATYGIDALLRARLERRRTRVGKHGVHVAHQGGPQLVKRAVLIAATTRIDERTDRAFLNLRNTDGWMDEMKDPFLRHMDEDFLRVQWAAICDVVHEFVLFFLRLIQLNHRVYLNYGGRFPSDLLLGQLKVPVLVVSGGMDRFIMDQKQLTQMIPNARQEVHAQGGHDFYVRAPRWLALKVTTFVNETPNGKSAAKI
ncbi:putative alpha/beta hydrolase [Aphelenchoides fujianensis]|nr:putative alpha/beta hydrolase [Aphelenchoides fujianensis]